MSGLSESQCNPGYATWGNWFGEIVTSPPTPAAADPPESGRSCDADALKRHSDLSVPSGARLSFSVGPRSSYLPTESR